MDNEASLVIWYSFGSGIGHANTDSACKDGKPVFCTSCHPVRQETASPENIQEQEWHSLKRHSHARSKDGILMLFEEWYPFPYGDVNSWQHCLLCGGGQAVLGREAITDQIDCPQASRCILKCSVPHPTREPTKAGGSDRRRRHSCRACYEHTHLWAVPQFWYSPSTSDEKSDHSKARSMMTSRSSQHRWRWILSQNPRGRYRRVQSTQQHSWQHQTRDRERDHAYLAELNSFGKTRRDPR